jgi:hypothetical protein
VDQHKIRPFAFDHRVNLQAIDGHELALWRIGGLCRCFAGGGALLGYPGTSRNKQDKNEKANCQFH